MAFWRTAKGFTVHFRGLWEGLPKYPGKEIPGMAPMDEQFTSGLRNIRDAIESRLRDSGVEGHSLGDTYRGCALPVPGMVIIDVGGNDRTVRVTFTRDEIEDCWRHVDAYCVKSKIDHAVVELLR
jgi:hypothetical protein